MFSSKATTRASRALRNTTTRTAVKRSAPARRQYATEPVTASTSNAGSSSSSGGLVSSITGGLIGGGAVFLAGYGYYHFSGAKTVVQTSQTAKQYADSAAEQIKSQLKELAPGSNDDPLSQLKSFAQKYASWIPGGRDFVDKSFKDLEDIKSKHKNEVDEIARATYNELKEAADKNGASLNTLNDIWNILSQRLGQLTNLAGDAAQQILDNHPEAKEKLGGSFDQLKQLGDRLGPEAKKQVEETFQEASKIASTGFSAESASRIYKLVQNKAEELKKVGDQSWDAGWEQIKPLLEKNPRVKELVEQSKDTLKNGHVTDVIDKVKTAAQSGSTSGLERYIEDTKKKADQYSGSGLSSWLSAFPNGSQVLPQLQKLKEAAEQKGPEAQDLAKKTVNDIQKILEDRSKQAEELLKK